MLIILYFLRTDVNQSQWGNCFIHDKCKKCIGCRELLIFHPQVYLNFCCHNVLGKQSEHQNVLTSVKYTHLVNACFHWNIL